MRINTCAYTVKLQRKEVEEKYLSITVANFAGTPLKRNIVFFNNDGSHKIYHCFVFVQNVLFIQNVIATRLISPAKKDRSQKGIHLKPSNRYTTEYLKYPYLIGSVHADS